MYALYRSVRYTSDTSIAKQSYCREYLLKLYLYCYMNGIRSSRKMETETKRNTELMLLTGKFKLNHGTLSAFMRNKQTAINLF